MEMGYMISHKSKYAKLSENISTIGLCQCVFLMLLLYVAIQQTNDNAVNKLLLQNISFRKFIPWCQVLNQ